MIAGVASRERKQRGESRLEGSDADVFEAALLVGYVRASRGAAVVGDLLVAVVVQRDSPVPACEVGRGPKRRCVLLVVRRRRGVLRLIDEILYMEPVNTSAMQDI